MSAAPKTSPPDASPSTSGGEHQESLTPIWDELEPRWVALQPLLARTVEEAGDA